MRTLPKLTACALLVVMLPGCACQRLHVSDNLPRVELPPVGSFTKMYQAERKKLSIGLLPDTGMKQIGPINSSSPAGQ